MHIHRIRTQERYARSKKKVKKKTPVVHVYFNVLQQFIDKIVPLYIDRKKKLYNYIV